MEMVRDAGTVACFSSPTASCLFALTLQAAEVIDDAGLCAWALGDIAAALATAR